MGKQQKILSAIMASLVGGAVLFMILSKVESALLMVGLALLSVFFGLLTYVSISAMRKQEREARNRKIEELLNAEDDDDDVVIESKQKKRPNFDKYSYVMLSIIATCVCVYMFIRSIISF